MTQSDHAIRLRRCLGVLLAAVFVLGAWLSPAGAHGRLADPSGPRSGLFLPPIAHPQMPGMADQASAIRRLAERLLWDDRDSKRVLQFLEYQSFACLWGRVPGSVTDENSPFNECAHAYLAGVQALLVRMQAVRGDLAAVRELTQAVTADPLAAVPLCQFSAEGFWTGNIVSPDWADMPHHPELVLWLVGLLMAVGGVAWAAVAVLRQLTIKAAASNPPGGVRWVREGAD